MTVSCMRNASGHNYRNSSFIVDVAMGQIPRSTERISSIVYVIGLCQKLCDTKLFCPVNTMTFWSVKHKVVLLALVLVSLYHQRCVCVCL